MLEIKDLSVQIGTASILKQINFTVLPGQWVMIVGPNGAGKSTIINAISQGVPYQGSVLLNGRDVKKLKPNVRAKEIGVLMQNHYVSYPFTVEEVVRMGRYAYAQSVFSKQSDEDEKQIEDAIQKIGLFPFLKQSVLTLSGGELQRTFLAQLFAQNPNILLLDEPTNHLDLVYQRQVFELVREWLKKEGRAVVSVVHDLSLAKTYGTDAILLHDGVIKKSGRIQSVLQREILEEIYHIDVYEWMQKMLSQWQATEEN